MKIKRVFLSIIASSILLVVPIVHAASIITVSNSNHQQAQVVLGSTVIPYKEVTLTAQIPGVVRKIAGDVGLGVREGTALVQIDDAQLQAKRNEVLAGIQTAQTGLRNSQIQYQRELISPRSKDVGAMPGFALPSMMDMFMVRPFANSFLSGYNSDVGRYSDLMNSASNVSRAQSHLQQAYSQLQGLDVSLRDARSVSPFDGVIMEKMVEEGDTVQPGQPLLRLGMLKYKRLLADVPSGLVDQLKVGMELPAKVDGQLMVKARVSQIYPVADPERHTVKVKLDLPISAQAAPGMYAEIHLPSQSAAQQNNSKLLIPASALLKGRSLPSVLVVAEDTSKLRMIRTGSTQDNGLIEVLSGLKEGEQIIDGAPSTAGSGWMPQ